MARDALLPTTRLAPTLVQRWRCLGKIHQSVGLTDDALDIRDRGTKRVARLSNRDVRRDDLGSTFADATHRLKVHLDRDEFVEQCLKPHGFDRATRSLIASTSHN
jgi:hypothetical protein